MIRGEAPKNTGIFDSKPILGPTRLAGVYENGGLPLHVDVVGGEEENGRPKGGRTIKWLKPIKEVDLEELMPILFEGLQESREPLSFIAEKGLEELIAKVSVKRMLKAIRSFVFPLKNNLRTLDDQVCFKTIKLLQQLCKRSDKLTEAFVPHFHLILPNLELVKNKHDIHFGLPLYKRQQIKSEQKQVEKNMKLTDLKKARDRPDLISMVQDTLEYFERHGGLMALVTIKKYIPRYESCCFS